MSTSSYGMARSYLLPWDAGHSTDHVDHRHWWILLCISIQHPTRSEKKIAIPTANAHKHSYCPNLFFIRTFAKHGNGSHFVLWKVGKWCINICCRYWKSDMTKNGSQGNLVMQATHSPMETCMLTAATLNSLHSLVSHPCKNRGLVALNRVPQEFAGGQWIQNAR